MSAWSTTSISACPTPTVSTRTSSHAGRVHDGGRLQASRRRGRRGAPRLAIERMKTRGSSEEVLVEADRGRRAGRRR